MPGIVRACFLAPKFSRGARRVPRAPLAKQPLDLSRGFRDPTFGASLFGWLGKSRFSLPLHSGKTFENLA